MALTTGTRVGPYEITGLLGVGGMGEVYRATDVNLRRQVAIKVLPTSVAGDGERRTRFQREAEVLAALNHPHIAQIYGLEKSSGAIALVMELVDGDTLAERIASRATPGSNGRGLPLDEALSIAKQIAEALEAAHEQGIIHRDLKPANIKVTPSGVVKVLDFGLAKALDVGRVRSDPAGASQAPTITAPALATGAGVILGTVAYMSPEQARGERVDTRGDIWAFGCVLYELLTGRRAFPGRDRAEVLGAVMHKEPAWELLPTALPAVLGRFLRLCLHKEPGERVRNIGDVRLALDGRFELDPPPGALRPRTTFPRAVVPWLAATSVVLALGSGWLGWRLKPDVTAPVSRFAHQLSADQSFTGAVRPLVAIAPDGSSLVYVANNRLYRRLMGDLEAVPIRGTEGQPSTPFFSPDGQSIGYWDAGSEQLRTVTLSGGTPFTVTKAVSFYGATWSTSEAIVFGQEDGIWQVSANGGLPQRLVQIAEDERVHGPQLLPDGQTLLFSLIKVGSMVGVTTAWDTAQVVAQSLQTGARTAVVSGSDARYVSTGHLIYALGSTLFAAPFDLATLEVRGRSMPVVEGVARAVRTPGSSGSANYDVSRRGTLAYVYGGGRQPEAPMRSLVSVDVTGRATPLLDEQRDYWRPRVSADGSRVVVEVLDPENVAQLWVVDVPRRTAAPLTAGRNPNPFAAWTPDGRSVVYRSSRGGQIGLYRQAADGRGDTELLMQFPREVVPTDISRDGVVVFAEGPQTGERLIRTLRLGEPAATEFLDTPAYEHMAMFSPDGKWVAYASNESGQMEVYVRPFPRSSGVGRLVSAGGGEGPVWAPDGAMLYYRGATGELMAVPTTLTPTFTAGPPRPLFQFDRVFRVSGNASAFDITPDGTRFIMVTEPDQPVAAPRQVNVVENWTEELKRLVPTR